MGEIIKTGEVKSEDYIRILGEIKALSEDIDRLNDIIYDEREDKLKARLSREAYGRELRPRFAAIWYGISNLEGSRAISKSEAEELNKKFRELEERLHIA